MRNWPGLIDRSWSGVSAYGMSKGAIGSMTRALAVEWAPANVQVNAIAPGVIRTDLNAALWEKREMREFVDQFPDFEVPVERLATWLARGGSGDDD